MTQNVRTPTAHGGQSQPVQLYPGVHPNSVKIHKYYCNMHKGNFVRRSGYGACGAYGDHYEPNAPPDYHRIESDTEHASACITLLTALHFSYPHLLTDEDFTQAILLLQHHDIGENDGGDVMDDGNRNEAERDQAELLCLKKSIAGLPSQARESLTQDFIYFQDPFNPKIPVSAIPRIQTARSIDKLETVLSGAFYEAHGAIATLTYKDEHFGLLTDRDRQSIIETEGDSSIVATWLVQVVLHYHACYAFPYVLDVIKAAIIDLRGKWFPWFDRFCERHQIPPEHVNHPHLQNSQLTIHNYHPN